MFCVLCGPSGELQAIISVYLSTILSGFATGFSAVALPSIEEEMRYKILIYCKYMLVIKE